MSLCESVFPDDIRGSNYLDIAWSTGIAMVFLSPITIIGNVLVLVSVLLDPFKNIRSAPSCYIIFNLALADLLVGVLAYPLSSFSYIYFAINNKDIESFFFVIVLVSVTLSVGVSNLSLIALSIDRLIAIKTPLQYASRVTKGRVKKINLFIWIYAVVSSVGFTFPCSRSVFAVGVVTNTAFSVVLVSLNIAMVLSVRAQAKNVKKTIDSENKVVLQNAFARERVVTRTAIIMVVAFVVCVLPCITFPFIQLVFAESTDIKINNIRLWLSNVAVTLSMFNSLINPFLYAWRFPKYRKALPLSIS